MSVFAACKFALPHLRKVKGNIINMSSLVGAMGQLHATTYVATKGAVTALTKALAVDEAAHDVRVNSVSPGNIYTPLWQEAIDAVGRPRRHARRPATPPSSSAAWARSKRRAASASTWPPTPPSPPASTTSSPAAPSSPTGARAERADAIPRDADRPRPEGYLRRAPAKARPASRRRRTRLRPGPSAVSSAPWHESSSSCPPRPCSAPDDL